MSQQQVLNLIGQVPAALAECSMELLSGQNYRRRVADAAATVYQLHCESAAYELTDKQRSVLDKRLRRAGSLASLIVEFCDVHPGVSRRCYERCDRLVNDIAERLGITVQHLQAA